MVLGLAALLLAGCTAESPPKILPVFVDGVTDEERPRYQRRARSDMLQEIERLKGEVAVTKRQLEALRAAGSGPRGFDAAGRRAALPVESAPTWEAAREILPRDAGGRVDWSGALEAGTIKPRSELSPGSGQQPLFTLDVDLADSGSSFLAALFSHSVHTRWLVCQNCHPSIFPLGERAERAPATMAKIVAGKSCGVCHGPVAFGVEQGCARCHPKVPARSVWQAPEARVPLERARTWEAAVALLPQTNGAPDWVKALADGLIAPRPGLEPGAEDRGILPINVERRPQGDEAFKVVFPHAPHTALIACDSCHAELFKMQGGATSMSMDAVNEGKLCGRCHGPVAFSTDACGRCHPAMTGG